jgi:hypothetical protein
MHAVRVVRNPIHQPAILAIGRPTVIAERTLLRAQRVDPIMNSDSSQLVHAQSKPRAFE